MLSACKIEYPTTPLSLAEAPDALRTCPPARGVPKSTRPSPHFSAQAIHGFMPYAICLGVASLICSMADAGA